MMMMSMMTECVCFNSGRFETEFILRLQARQAVNDRNR